MAAGGSDAQDDDTGTYMTARDLLRIVREGWVIILAAAIVFGIAGAVYSGTRTPTYQSTATLSVSACAPIENSDACDPVSGISFAVQRASIYASVGTSAPVLRAALEETDEVQSRRELAEVVSVTQASDSPLVEVTATSHTAAGAAAIANALADALIGYATESIDNVDSELARVQFSVISEAVPPLEATESDRQTVLLAVSFGLLLGMAGAYALWFFNTRVRDSSELKKLTGLDVFAELPIAGRSRSKVVAAVSREGSSAAEFHQLRTVISTRLKESASTIAVVAPGASERATIVAQGLATSFAATRTRVAVLHLHDREGAVTGPIDLREILIRNAAEPFASATNPLVVSYQGSAAEASVMLGTPDFASALAEIRAAVDVVIIDAASDGADAEMTGAVRHSDSALVVVEPGRTRRSEIDEVLRALDLVHVKALGAAAVTKSN